MPLFGLAIAALQLASGSGHDATGPRLASGPLLCNKVAMRMIDPSHPFFRPAWRRYLVVAAPFLWAGFEWNLGNTIWGYLFAVIGGYLAWHLVLNWRPDNKD